MNGEPTRRRPISLAELASVPHRMRATLAVDLGQWQREVTARAQLPAELLSVLVQAYVVRPCFSAMSCCVATSPSTQTCLTPMPVDFLHSATSLASNSQRVSAKS